MLRYAVVGSGAVGCFYGAQLADAGARVQFLFRHDAQRVRDQGIEVTSPSHPVHVAQPHVASSWEELEPCDLLIVAVKATSNGEVLAHIRAHGDRILGERGCLLLIQNGIGAERGYAEALVTRTVLGGLAFLCSHNRSPGQIAHLDYGALTIAAHTPDETSAGVVPEMDWVSSDLRSAGIEVALDGDLIRARWRKLLWNIPFNALSVILDATTDQLIADPDSVGLVRSLMAEVVDAAAAEGRQLPADVIDHLVAATAAMRPYAPSMKLDADAGRPLEIEAILGEPLRRSERAGSPMPGVRVLHRQLAFLDRRARDGAAARST